MAIPEQKNPGGAAENRSVSLGRNLLNVAKDIMRHPKPRMIVSEDGRRYFRILEGSPQGIQIETGKVNNRGIQSATLTASAGAETLDIKPSDSAFAAVDPAISSSSVLAIDAIAVSQTGEAATKVSLRYMKSGVLVYLTHPQAVIQAPDGDVQLPIYPVTYVDRGSGDLVGIPVGPTPEMVVKELQWARVEAAEIVGGEFLKAHVLFRVLRY